jgi:hypothetical protein
MAIKQLKTFKDLVDAIREEIGIQTTDDTAISRIKRAINIAYQEICGEKQWNWLQGQTQVQLPAYVSNGTAAVVTGSAQVTLTNAPPSSKRGHYFAVDGFSELYRIEAHTAGDTVIKLETEYNGTTNAAVNYKVWTDKIPLPIDLTATVEVRHDHSTNVLEEKGLQEFRRQFAINPRADAKPSMYYVTDYVDPVSTTAVANLPAVASRLSTGMQKTLVFAGSLPNAIISKIDSGEPVRWNVTGAGHYSFNGEVILMDYATTFLPNDTVHYIGRSEHTEALIGDSGVAITQINSDSDYERYRELLVWPAIQPSKVSIHIDYIKEVFPLDLDTDEPVIPLADRIVLLYAALAGAWDKIGKDPMAADKNYQKFQGKLSKMAGKLQDNMDKPILAPSRSYLGNKRSSAQRGGNNMSGMGGGISSGASGAIVTGTPNTIAIFDNRGEIQGSSIPATSITTLSGIASNIQNQINAAVTRLTADEAAILATQGVDTTQNTRLDTAEGNITSILATDTTQNSRLTTAESILTTHTGNLATQNGLINANYNAIATNTAGIATNTTAIAANTAALASKEPAITAGSSAQYLKGDKTLGTFATDAAAAISGTSPIAITAGVVSIQTATDSVPGAMSAADHTQLTANTANIASNTTAISGKEPAITAGTSAQYLKGDKTLGTFTTDARAAFSATAPVTLTAGAIGVNSTVLTTTGTQVLTNKDIDGGTASNTSRFTIPSGTLAAITALTRKAGTILYATDTLKFYADNGSALIAVGSGSGSGGVEYLANPDGETDASGWNPFSTTFTGGIPGTITLTSTKLSLSRVTSNVIRGNASLQMNVTTASGATGHGVISDVFVLSDADLAKMLTAAVDYRFPSGETNLTLSGTSTQTLEIWVYNVGLATWTQPVGFRNIQTKGIPDKAKTVFQTDSSSASLKNQYRLAIIHRNDPAGVYAMNFEASVSPQAPAATGAAVTDWVAYTMTIGGTTTAPTKGTTVVDSAKWRRVGDSMELMYQFQWSTAGTAGSGTYTFPLPSGYSIDSNKLATMNNPAVTVGTYTGTVGGVGNFVGDTVYTGGNFLTLFDSTGASIGSARGQLSATTGGFSFMAKVPIAGWSSGVSMGGADDARQVQAKVVKSGTQAIAAGTWTQITGFTVSSDSHARFDTTNNYYVMPTAGVLNIGVLVSLDALVETYVGYTVNDATIANANSNRIAASGVGSAAGTGQTLPLNAGDIVRIGVITATARTIQSGAFTTVSFQKQGGSSSIAAAESVNASYSTAAGPSVGTSNAILKFATKDYDSHGRYDPSTGLYTVGVAGLYNISTLITTASLSLSGSQTFETYVYKNGSQYRQLGSTYGNGSTNTWRCAGNTDVPCLAGDTIAIYANSNVATTLYPASNINWLNIKKVGN